MNDRVVPRHFTPPLPLDIPRHWLPGNPVISSILNAYTVLVPANEAFYIRTFKRCMPRIASHALQQVGVDFIHQEAQHGTAHKRYWRNLDAQGYRFRGFEKLIDKLTFRTIERTMPVSLRMSLVACVEHINAFLGHEFLIQGLLVGAHPQMRALMEWHFAEEIEHKRVAFDVLNAVAPSYPVRLLGFLLTVPLFYLLISVTALRFLAQDRLLLKMRTWRQLFSHLGSGHHMLVRSVRHLGAYLRPRFDPDALDDRAMASAVIARYASAQPPMVMPTARSQRRDAGLSSVTA
ncbi:MAG: metal-dependent hydrolase [Pseudoxanthomonas sp.]